MKRCALLCLLHVPWLKKLSSRFTSPGPPHASTTCVGTEAELSTPCRRDVQSLIHPSRDEERTARAGKGDTSSALSYVKHTLHLWLPGELAIWLAGWLAGWDPVIVVEDEVELRLVATPNAVSTLTLFHVSPMDPWRMRARVPKRAASSTFQPDAGSQGSASCLARFRRCSISSSPTSATAQGIRAGMQPSATQARKASRAHRLRVVAD